MAKMFGGLIGCIWIFPIFYFVFGEENVWWIFSLLMSVCALLVLCGQEHIFDKISQETEVKGDHYFYMYNDYKED